MDGSTSGERIVLICEECGERTVLSGPLSVWLTESTSFGCECGKPLTLADHEDLRKVELWASKV